jgi:MYXO-CTERM domain-containing protein
MEDRLFQPAASHQKQTLRVRDRNEGCGCGTGGEAGGPPNDCKFISEKLIYLALGHVYAVMSCCASLQIQEGWNKRR